METTITVNEKKYCISKNSEFKNNGYYSGSYYNVAVFSKNRWTSLKNFETKEDAIAWIKSRNLEVA